MMMFRFALARAIVIVAVAAATPLLSRAQGNLSVQGLGFPPGQFSARAAGTAGALGEIDPASAMNPSSILHFGFPTLSMQLSPEFRKITANGQTDNTTTQRFPLFMGAMPFGSRLMLAISASTLLDRTWRTNTPDAQVIGGDTVRFNSTITSDGALNDIRFAVGYAAAPWMHLGLGLHAMSGRDVVTHARTFEDTLRFGNTKDPRTNSYIGNALSAGVTVFQDKLGSLALSWRRGGHLEQRVVDTLVGAGRVPDRLGASASYDGFGGLTLVARTALEKWSSLVSLGSSTGPARDSWDSSIGAESSGGQFGGIPLQFRLGARWRNLPFPATGDSRVREGTLAAGMGLALAQGRALLDFGVLRASRSAGIPVTESALTLSAGLTIRTP